MTYFCMQRSWLNAYNQRCLQEVGEAILRDQRKNNAAYEWVRQRTFPIDENPKFSEAPTLGLSLPALVLLVLGTVVAT